MDATERARRRFAETVAGPPGDLRLDVAALCIAAHAHPGLDIDDCCSRLDELAVSCPAPTFEALRAYLFEHERFRGNLADYGDPENSFLDSVVSTRLGIPITLAVVMMEVGRRIGVEVQGIGMPGHFLIQDGGTEGAWCDPFHGGARLDLDACRRLFTRLHGPARQFHIAYLSPSQPVDILARILTNLEQGRLATDPLQLLWMCDLHLELPDLAAAEQQRLDVARRTVRARWN
jgi:regulator of sirC expression with transglutaminase-like and TPR domain